MSDKALKHIPVLLKESIDFLDPKTEGVYVDCTLGGGGHTEEIKTRSPSSKIIGIDADYEVMIQTREKLERFQGIEFINDNFKNIKSIVNHPVDGILFDLGVSSYQIDEPGRGFSLQKDGPLDMRMDRSQKLTAEEIINRSSRDELEKIFREYGEEHFSRKIAKAIIQKREKEKIKSTLQLKDIVEKSIFTWKKRESVTRIFQALRIAVNQELKNLESALRDSLDLLKPSGRIVVISYHSLEDRMVKHTLREAGKKGALSILTKKPVRPSDNEISSNPRARSAKLRAAEKI
jgi:16S rRNA (cytosine1402-N4)-methyltransferase